MTHTLLNDPEWAAWSDREIARRAAVSHEFVSRIRPSLSTNDSEKTYTTKHGTTAKMKTSLAESASEYTRRDSPKSQREWLTVRYAATVADVFCIDTALLKLSSKCAIWYTLMRQADAAYRELERIRKFHSAADDGGNIYEFLEPRRLQSAAEFPQPIYPSFRAFESAHLMRIEVIAAPRKYAPTVLYYSLEQ